MQREHDQSKAIRLLNTIVLRHTLGPAFELLLRLSIRKAKTILATSTTKSLIKSPQSHRERDQEYSTEAIISPSKKEELFKLIRE